MDESQSEKDPSDEAHVLCVSMALAGFCCCALPLFILGLAL